MHRDLKPANIFLCPDDSEGVRREHVKVLDFGISKILGSDTVHTQANVLMVYGHVQTFNYNPRKPPNDKLATDFKRRNLYVNP